MGNLIPYRKINSKIKWMMKTLASGNGAWIPFGTLRDWVRTCSFWSLLCGVGSMLVLCTTLVEFYNVFLKVKIVYTGVGCVCVCVCLAGWFCCLMPEAPSNI